MVKASKSSTSSRSKVIIITSILSLVGCTLILLSLIISEIRVYAVASGILVTFGTLLLISFGSTLIYELFLRKSTIKEFLEYLNLKERLEKSGIIDYYNTAYESPFRELLENAQKVDLFIIHGRTWIKSHREYIRNCLKHKTTDMRICLLDPTFQPAVTMASEVVRIKKSELRNLIYEVKKMYQELIEPKKEREYGRLRVYFGKFFLFKSFLRVDNKMVYTIDPMTGSRGEHRPIPSIILESTSLSQKWISDSSLMGWIMYEFERYLKLYSECVFDSRNNPK